jgi:hypothetical protein
MTAAGIAGVLAVNAGFAALGYCLLAVCLRGLSAWTLTSYAGVALLVGAAGAATALVAIATLGATLDLPTVAATGIAVAGLGLLALRLPPAGRRRVAAPRPAPRAPLPRWSAVVAGVLGSLLVTLAVVLVIDGFRTAPWLDDTWTLWLPKGLALTHSGLDVEFFRSGRQLAFGDADYPLAWSVWTALATRAGGEVDVRAVNAQLAIMVVAFLAAAARLMWGHVRPWILLGALLMLAASPELVREAQSGGADLPLAMFLALFALCAFLWLAHADGLALLASLAFAAAAVATKSEGAPLMALFAAVAGTAAWRLSRRRTLVLWGAAAVALATSLPWFFYREVHDLANETSKVPATKAIDPGYLFDREDRVGPALSSLTSRLLDPADWLIVVPLLVVLAATAAVASRRPVWLTSLALVGAGLAFWTLAFWSDPNPIDERLAKASYRVVMSVVLPAALALAVVGEGVARLRSGRSHPCSR